MAAATPSSPRALLHPTNVRFAVMVLIISVVVFGSNLCAQSSIVRGIVGSSALTRLPDDIAGVGRAVAAVAATAERLSQQEQQIDGKLSRILAMETRVVYTHDPSKQMEPDPQSLEQLRGLVLAGAEIRVVHRPVNAEGPVRSVLCADVIVDENGGILCTTPVLAANLTLPDGRRYQETIRHDGTMIYAHWDATGANVQGGKQIGAYVSTWLARGPLR